MYVHVDINLLTLVVVTNRTKVMTEVTGHTKRLARTISFVDAPHVFANLIQIFLNTEPCNSKSK